MGRGETTVLIVVAVLLIAFVGCIVPGIPPRHAWGAIEVGRIHFIADAMLRYAGDHAGQFPSGASSTKVFQQLIDGGYADAPVFYFPMRGKTPGLDGHPLKPENVCYDVTNPVDSSDSGDLPLVFSTGFKVGYASGASARKLVANEFRLPGFELFRPDPGPSHMSIVIGYKRGEVRILLVTDDPASPHGSARDFIPASFKASGKTYQQLTPDGVLPAK